MAVEVELACEMDMLLGEGPVWLPECKELAFVDIKGRAVHRLNPLTGQLTSVIVDSPPTFIVEAMEGDLLVGSGRGVFRFGEGGLGKRVITIPQPDNNRTNDATVDRSGRLWFGTMDDHETHATGTIWSYKQSVLRDTMVRAVITNGPATTSNGALLYYVDSTERTIWRCQIDETGQLQAPERFIVLKPEDGYPDGIVLDAENNLWVGLWDGWAVRQYSPAGRLVDEIQFPCARVTKIAFGGDDFRTAYATTARVGLDNTELARQPLAGSVFSFRTKVPGAVASKVLLV